MLIYGGMKIPRFGRPAVWMVAGFAILLVAKVILYIGHRAIVSSIDDLGGRQNMYMMLSFMSTVTSMLTLLGNCVIGSSVFMNRETQKNCQLVQGKRACLRCVSRRRGLAGQRHVCERQKPLAVLSASITPLDSPLSARQFFVILPFFKPVAFSAMPLPPWSIEFLRRSLDEVATRSGKPESIEKIKQQATEILQNLPQSAARGN